MVTDLVGRVVDRLLAGVWDMSLGLALGVLGVAGCQNAEVAPTTPVVATERVAVAIADAGVPADAEPQPLGKFNITFYYVVGEDEVTPKKKQTVLAPPVIVANDNQGSDSAITAAITPPALVTLYSKSGCEPIQEVTKEFAAALEMQGTGKLRDGRVLNIWGACNCERTPCFKVTENQWGTAGSGHPLQPFRTVAVDPKVVKIGSLLHVPLLEGRLMPGRAPWGGFVHDGCVVADDTGGGINDNQLDLFVGRKAYFLGISGHGGSHAWARNIDVYDGTSICERKGRKISKKAGGV